MRLPGSWLLAFILGLVAAAVAAGILFAGSGW
jgi:hypothetical protein